MERTGGCDGELGRRRLPFTDAEAVVAALCLANIASGQND
jgi:hypothetical protein